MHLGSSLLFVPGDNPGRMEKALASAADSVALDLEDAVADSAKEAARECIRKAVRSARRRSVLVRVNDVRSGQIEADLELLREIGLKISGVLVPKAEAAEDLIQVDDLLIRVERSARTDREPAGVVPIVETARGVLAARELAAALTRPTTLLFGPLDLAAELGLTITADGGELVHARSQLVLASAAEGRPAPLDGPYQYIEDDAGLARSSTVARELGYAGKAVIHPRQIPIVDECFSPTDEQLAWARDIVDAYRTVSADGLGAALLPDGTFLERPVVLRAAAMLRTRKKGPEQL